MPSHRVFNLYLDIISDTTDLETFREVLGFTPPADPLLNAVFSEEAAISLGELRNWDIPDSVLIADPDLLASMKIRSIPDRDREQKRVKDVADLHSLLWYTREYNEIRKNIRSKLSDKDLDRMNRNLDLQMYEQAANLLQIESELVQDTIEQLIQ